MNILDLDYLLVLYINKYLTPQFNALFIFLMHFVYGVFLILVLYYFFKKQETISYRLILIFLIGILIITFLKYAIGRPRPYEAYPEIKTALVKQDSSFPSMHAFISFLSASFLPITISKRYRYLIYFYLLVFIPLLLMYMGIHYLSDVVMGAFIGILLPKIVSENIFNKLTKYFHKK